MTCPGAHVAYTHTGSPHPAYIVARAPFFVFPSRRLDSEVVTYTRVNTGSFRGGGGEMGQESVLHVRTAFTRPYSIFSPHMYMYGKYAGGHGGASFHQLVETVLKTPLCSLWDIHV